MTSIVLRLGAPVAVVFLSIGACASGPAKTPTGALASCHGDDDCVVTDFAACCACCKSEPRALPRGEDARRRNACTPESCPKCDEHIECANVQRRVADLVAKCDQGTCAAVPR